MKRFTRILLIGLLLPSEVWAAPYDPPGLWATGLKLLVGTLLVIGLMLLVYVLNRKGFSLFRNSSPSRIQIVENRPVGGKKSVCLVRVRGEDFLLGLGGDQVQLLFHFGSSQDDHRFESELQERVEAGR